MILAVLALFVFHVQVITRIASGYPIVYIWAAGLLEGRGGGKVKVGGQEVDLGRVVVQFGVIYAVVQGGLFASFMPPA